MTAAWIKALQEAEQHLVEELRQHYSTKDTTTLADVECNHLTIGDLRMLAVAMDDYLHTTVAEAEKRNDAEQVTQ
jgi:hypothetical protein